MAYAATPDLVCNAGKEEGEYHMAWHDIGIFAGKGGVSIVARIESTCMAVAARTGRNPRSICLPYHMVIRCARG